MRLKVKSSKVSYDLELRHKLTLIMGDSATGKTTLVNTIKNANRDKRTVIESEYPVIVVNNIDTLRDGVALGKSRIYVIDERDINDEFGRLYNKSVNSYFIVITRDVINNISYSPESLCILQKSGRNHYLQYTDMKEVL